MSFIMSTRPDTTDELIAFYLDLKKDLVEWLRASGTKQAVLASILGIDVSQVSHAIRPAGSVSENFIRKLSASVPHFSGAYARFYSLKYGVTLPPGSDDFLGRAERIERLRVAEEEVVSAVRALTQAAIDYVRRS